MLAKSVLIPVGLTVAASATDAAIHEKMFGSGRPLDLASRTIILIISNGEINDITKIISLLKNLVWSKTTKKKISLNVIRHFRC